MILSHKCQLRKSLADMELKCELDIISDVQFLQQQQQYFYSCFIKRTVRHLTVPVSNYCCSHLMEASVGIRGNSTPLYYSRNAVKSEMCRFYFSVEERWKQNQKTINAFHVKCKSQFPSSIPLFCCDQETACRARFWNNSEILLNQKNTNPQFEWTLLNDPEGCASNWMEHLLHGLTFWLVASSFAISSLL